MTQSSCLCGANRISYGETPILSFRCHCLDERKLTGAAFALNILWSTDELKVLSGELKTWSKVANSGNTITNQFVLFALPAFGTLDFLSMFSKFTILICTTVYVESAEVSCIGLATDIPAQL